MTVARHGSLRQQMQRSGTDVVLLSNGAELPWLSGVVADSRERLTMMVVPRDGLATLVVPMVEAPRVQVDPEVFEVRSWWDGTDPVALVAELCGKAETIAVGDQTWARFVLELQQLRDGTRWSSATPLVTPLREVKDETEIELLARVGAAADQVAGQLIGGEIALVGRTESEIAEDISRRLLAAGLSDVDFAIVGSGPNGASPHHEPGGRVVERGDAVVCDFGGPMNGYNADITRTMFVGEASGEMREVYELVRLAQQAGVEAAVVGARSCDVDGAARKVIADAGYGEYFIHRLGHGIGLEVHENPYISYSSEQQLVAGNVFSIEPGVYLPGKFGVRIEDIVVATNDGPRRLNNASRELTIV